MSNRFLAAIWGLLLSPVLWSSSYVGSEACRRCHPKIYRGWCFPFHPYMLRKASPKNLYASWEEIALCFGKGEIHTTGTILQKGCRRFWIMPGKALNFERKEVAYGV